MTPEELVGTWIEIRLALERLERHPADLEVVAALLVIAKTIDEGNENPFGT